MEQDWTTNGEEGRSDVEDAIASARASLRVAGFPASGRRFPFAMHHDAYRVRLPRLPDGSRTRHADVARLLNAWAVGRDPTDYAWQAIEGAVRAMVAIRPDLANAVPADVREGIVRVGEGREFLDFANRSLRTAA